MAGSQPLPQLPFDPAVLLDTSSWSEERVQMLDILVEIMYSQSTEILRQISSGNLQFGGSSSSSAGASSGVGGNPNAAPTSGGLGDNQVQVVTSKELKQENQRIVKAAHDTLHALKQNGEAWKLVDLIIEKSQNPASKFFALNLLDVCVKTKWRLPDLPRPTIRNYVTDLVIRVSSSEEAVKNERQFLTKLSEVLVHIVRQEWPQDWQEFIPDICKASMHNQFLCENNMRVLAMLSEDIFEFGDKQLVSKKVLELKTSFAHQFKEVFDLCMWVFQQYVQQPRGTVRPQLVQTTLITLSKFLNWIPFGYVFETELIPILFNHFWDPPDFRIECVMCLNEISCLEAVSAGGGGGGSLLVPGGSSSGMIGGAEAGAPNYRQQLLECFQATVMKINTTLPNDILERVRAGDRYSTHLIQQLTLLVTSFLKHNFDAVDENFEALSAALNFLVEVTAVPDEEIFKLCVESWDLVAGRLYLHGEQSRKAWLMENLQQGHGATDSRSHEVIRTELNDPKLKRYSPVLSRVREMLIMRMVKPPEVTIKENEEGHIVRADEVDTDEIALYRMMRGILVYLTHLNPENMDKLMLEKLSIESRIAQTGIHPVTNVPLPGPWSPTNLNKLCYAIGSVSGALSENHEKRFLVSVIKDLLALCDVKRGKENKAVVASNIMYVVGQYPSFLRAHWRFLKTVIYKLIEFMHETFPGVQEMAVDTFLRITQKCKKKFVVAQADAADPFLVELLEQTKSNVNDLDHLLITTYYEALGLMIGAAKTFAERERYVEQLMTIFNEIWAISVRALHIDQGASLCEDLDTLKKISLFLRLNERVAGTVGLAYTKQLRLIYQPSLQLYQLFSNYISQRTQQANLAIALKSANVKQMRTAKRATLRLVTTFLKRCLGKDSLLAAGGAANANSASGSSAGGGGNAAGSSSSAALDQEQLPAGIDSVAALEQEIAGFIVPPLLLPVLQDYERSPPEARDAEVLDLLAALITHLSKPISSEVPRIFEMIVEPTLRMLEVDLQNYPDHRVKLFSSLFAAINRDCFQALFFLGDDKLRLYINSLLWGMKHEHPVVSPTALGILREFLQSVLKLLPPQATKPFFTEYYAEILKGLLKIMTDTMHTSGLRAQLEVLLELIRGSCDEYGAANGLTPAVAANDGSAPSTNAFGVSQQQTMVILATFFQETYPDTLAKAQIETFVLGMFNSCQNTNEFAAHVTDFLKEVKVFGGSDEQWKAARDEQLQLQKQQEEARRSHVPGMGSANAVGQGGGNVTVLRRRGAEEDDDDL